MSRIKPLDALAWAAGAAIVLYMIVASVKRFAPGLEPWVAETDWKQWIWPYWRFHLDGAMPAGNPMTDYAFNAQPPLFNGSMALLSSFVLPVTAANIVNWIAWIATIAGVTLAVKSKSNWLVGLATAALFVRDDTIFRYTAGGYPRSFGPALTVLFLAALLAGRRRLALVVLIVAAGLYPSIVVPCGLCIGLWTAATTPRTSLKEWLRPNLEVLAAGVLIAVIAQLQSITAPDWWGPVVWAKDAGVELTARGRTAWLPLGPFWPKVYPYLFHPFTFSGDFPFGWKPSFTEARASDLIVGWFVVLGAVAVVRKKWLPLQIPLLIVCAIIAFWLAREFAFKLYLPHRMVQHTQPIIAIVAAGIFAFQGVRAIFGDKEPRRTIAALAFVILPVFFLAGNGIQRGGAWKSYAGNAKLYTWVQQSTQVSDQFAGHWRVLDELPFFTGREIYVGWKMAHPFRKGFFEEITKRTVAMYDAIYATDMKDVVAFADKADVQYFVIDTKLFTVLESGDGQLFEPIRSVIDRDIFRPRVGRFVLENPPPEIVVFRRGPFVVLSVEKMRALP